MAKVETRYMIERYTDDFGVVRNNVFFKIQAGAPKLDDLYQKRPTGLGCGGGLIFDPRKLKVTFNDGRVLLYPVPHPNRIDDFVKALKPSLVDNAIPGTGADEAVCIDLIGEQWTFVPPSILGNPTFKTTPYTNIPNRGLKESGTYEYVSDLDGVGKVTLPYKVEDNPTDLRDCQKEGLTNWKRGRGICSGASLGISPRHWIIQALASVDTNTPILPGGEVFSTVRRQAIVSAIDPNILPGSDRPIDVGKNIAKCAYCLGWQGESVKKIHNFYGTNILG